MLYNLYVYILCHVDHFPKYGTYVYNVYAYSLPNCIGSQAKCFMYKYLPLTIEMYEYSLEFSL